MGTSVRVLFFLAVFSCFEGFAQEPPPIDHFGDPPVVNPAAPVPPRKRVEGAREMRRQIDDEAEDFLKKFERQAREEERQMREMARRALAEHQRAFNAVVPADLYSLYLKNYERLIKRMEDLQKAMAGITIPENVKIAEALKEQLATFTTGPIGRKTKAYAEMKPADREKALKLDKKWLLAVLGKTEIVDHDITFAEKYLAALKDKGQPKDDTAWKDLVITAGTEARKEIVKSHDNSIFQKKHADIILAQPSDFKEAPLLMVDQMKYHWEMMEKGTDREAANHLLQLTWGLANIKVEDLPR